MWLMGEENPNNAHTNVTPGYEAKLIR